MQRWQWIALALVAGIATVPAHAQVPLLTLDGLPRPATPPPEVGPVLPVQVERWRREALAYEHGDGVPRDELRAAELYCRAARYGDAEAQFNLGWMLTNSRGIERNDAVAAHLFAAAAEQGLLQAKNMARALGVPQGEPPPCLRPPEEDVAPPTPVEARAPGAPRQPLVLTTPPLPEHAPEQIVRFVQLVAPEYGLEPWLVLAIMAAESNFNPWAVSPANARGLVQVIPDTAARFPGRDSLDPTQNIRGGMAYLRWLMAFFEGDIPLVLAAYNAGERAVERYRGVPPYAETRHYVRKIMARIGGRRLHPFDPKVTEPSPLAELIRRAMPR